MISKLGQQIEKILLDYKRLERDANSSDALERYIELRRKFNEFSLPLPIIASLEAKLMPTVLQNMQVERFFREGRLCYVESARAALAAGYNLPNAIEASEARIALEATSPVWRDWMDTISMRLTGRTNSSNVSRPGGSPVDAYYHGPLQIPLEYIQKQINRKLLINHVLRITQHQFDLMLAKTPADCIINLDVLVSSHSGDVLLSKAINHPQTIPFFASKERAERYLTKYGQVKDPNRIGIYHCNDLNETSPILRPLCLSDRGGLGAGMRLDCNGSFFGVRQSQNFPSGSEK